LNKNTVFVVTYQAYFYGDEYDDIERVMEGFDVEGVFSTKKKAQDFIKTDVLTRVDEDDKDAIREFKDHYSIYEFKIDGQS
jgi:hypothetical protein